MPTISVRNAAVAAGAVIENVLTGSQYEYLPFDALVEFGIVASGVNVVRDVFSGSDTLIEAGSISAANRHPVYPDDFDLTDVAVAGERLKVRLRNTDAAARDIITVVRITPV